MFSYCITSKTQIRAENYRIFNRMPKPILRLLPYRVLIGRARLILYNNLLGCIPICRAYFSFQSFIFSV